jgi:hypothetical protein
LKFIKPFVRKILTACIVIILVLGFCYLKFSKTIRFADISVATIENNTKIQLFKLYDGCGHLIEQKEYELEPSEFEKLSIYSRYPAEEGWSIIFEGDTVKAIESVGGLCPTDGEMRHLGVEKGFLAIYLGPSHLNGPIYKTTRIKIKKLPVELQEKIYDRSIEFKRESELLEALDSLDEYQ